MFFYYPAPLSFTDPETGTTLSIDAKKNVGEIKEIKFKISDQNGEGNQITISSEEDLRQISDYLLGKTPIMDTAPTYNKSSIGLYYFYGNAESEQQSDFIYDPELKNTLEWNYELLSRQFNMRPDAFVLFFWYDGSISRNAIRNVIHSCLDWQREYVVTGDPRKCRRMTLNDIANQTGVDITSVSRCTSQEVRIYTPHTTFTLDNHHSKPENPSLFDEGIPGNSAEVSRTKILALLRDITDKEDKGKPYSDEKIVTVLKDMGIKIERRTVAKYRKAYLRIPSSANRKKR